MLLPEVARSLGVFREVCPAAGRVHLLEDKEANQITEHLKPVAREYRWPFPPGPDVPRHARRLLEPALVVWGLSPDQSEDVLLVTHELVSNAVEHARTGLVMVVRFTGAAVVVQVSDQSTTEPRLQPFDTNAARGRGLQFVEALSRRWSWSTSTRGKTVWAEIDTLVELPLGI